MTSSNNDFSTEVINNLSSNLEQAQIQAITRRIDQHNKLSTIETRNHKLIIAIGSLASKHLFEQDISIPILSLLVPSQSLESLIELKQNDSPWSVILLDQPLQRQIIFSQYLLGDDKKPGFLLGPYSKKLLSQITNIAHELDIDLAIEVIDNESNLIPSIKNLINNSDMILSLPDPVAFNRKTIRGILLLSYRNKTPVIGFSSSYTKAGALGAIYSTPEQISQQASEIINSFINNNVFEKSFYYPIYYTISINSQVARTLGLSMIDNVDILEQIKEFERKK